MLSKLLKHLQTCQKYIIAYEQAKYDKILTSYNINSPSQTFQLPKYFIIKPNSREPECILWDIDIGPELEKLSKSLDFSSYS